MVEIINQILVLFILILVGFIITKLKIIDDQMINSLSGLLLKITLPAFIISSMQLKEMTEEILNTSVFLLEFSIFTYSVAIILALFIPKLIKAPKEDAGVYKFMLVFANVGFMAYPVLGAILGKESIFYAAIYNLSFNVLVYTVGIYFLTKHNKVENDFTWKKFINPGVIAVIIGFSLFILNIKLPYALKESLNLIGNLTTPLSMLIIGGLLTHVEFGSLFKNWRLYFISFIRLVLFPLFVLFTVRMFSNDEMVVGTIYIIAAMPMGTNGGILAEQYNANAELASQAIFISTLLSIITIPIMVMML